MEQPKQYDFDFPEILPQPRKSSLPPPFVWTNDFTDFPEPPEAMIEGIKWDKAPVAVDGNVVTGNGPAAAAPFALTLVEQSLGRDKAVEVANGMLLAY